MEDPDTVAAIMVEPIGHTGGVIDPPRRVPADPPRDLRPAQHPADLRRDHHRHRPDRPDVRRRDVRRRARRALRGQGAERRLRPALGDDLPPADRRRLLGADRGEPRVRRGAHLRGEPDLLRRGDRRAARDPRARPLRQRPPRRASGSAPGSSGSREKYGVIGDIRGKGLFQAVEFVRDRATKEPFPDGFGVRVGRRALANGLLCRFDPNWIAFGPPLVSTAEQIDEMVAILDRSLGEVLDELPAGAVRCLSRRPAPSVTRRTAAAPRESAWSAAVGAGPGATSFGRPWNQETNRTSCRTASSYASRPFSGVASSASPSTPVSE